MRVDSVLVIDDEPDMQLALKHALKKNGCEVHCAGNGVEGLKRFKEKKYGLVITDMRMPEIGESGIYFIETLGQQQVHPLIGWQQGHYRVIIDPQTGRKMVVSDEDRQEAPAKSLLLRQGTELEDFKESIRSVMEEDQ